MLINGLLVFFGGGIGSLLRYLVNLITQIYTFNYIGTLLVNTIGSFLFGFFIIFAKDKNEYFNIFFLAGVLGGFTTFSQFSYDVINLQNESNLQSIIYLLLSLLLSVLLAFAGMILANRILK
jgi:CrcB protein